MLARIRKAQENREGGFTLIELLVVMIIIGILAAIAIPVFLNQRKKAQDTGAKADVSTVGKEVATYFVDHTDATKLAVDSTSTTGRYTLTDSSVSPAVTQDLGRVSQNNSLVTTKFTNNQSWCVAVKNSQTSNIFKYSATNGLNTGDCISGTDY